MLPFTRLLLPCLALLLTAPSSWAVADDENRRTDVESGLPVVKLRVERQQLAGLQTVAARPLRYRPEYSALGKALNVQPLVALRSQYRVARSEQTSAHARLAQSGQSIRRAEALFRHGVTAQRNVEAQQSLWQTDKAQLEARRAQSAALREDARVVWGAELAEWAFADGQDRLHAFVSGEQALLLVTLPAGKSLPARDAAVFADPEGNRSHAVAASFISPAPQIDATVQGESYFFRADGKKIRPGMAVSVWLPESGAAESGVEIPTSALIWSLDQAFVYVKIADDAFSRRPLADFTALPDGYFVRGDLRPGEEIVSVGGQTLLSEEFRAQIPDEDD